MNDQRKITYQKKYILQLEEQIKNLKQENEALRKDAEMKESFYQRQADEFDAKFDAVEGMQKIYEELIGELNEMKVEYRQALNDVAKITDSYKKHLAKEVKSLRRQFKE